MKKVAFILGFILMQFFGIAQEHLFNVIASSGDAKLSNGTALKSGDQVLSNQTIVVGDGAYVALMHKTGKTIELQKVGTFPAAKLTQDVNKDAKSYAAQYSGFVVEQMAGGSSSGSYSNTGSVNRDIMKNIEVLLPKEVNILKNTPFQFSWVSPQKGDTYTIKIVDLFNNVLHKELVTSNQFKLDISAIDQLKGGGKMFYLLQVCSNQKNDLVSKKIKLIIKTPEEEQKISTEFASLKTELGNKNAINSLIIASFYEAQGLTAYAANNLEEATHQAPKVDHYQKIYLNYLSKNKVNTAYLEFKDDH
jgi:hypothetical protein